MIRHIERTWFEVWGTEQAQNRILKGFLALITLLATAETIGLVVLALRGPVIVTLSPSETKWFAPTPPSPELLETEVRRAIQNYVEIRHNWEGAKIEARLKLAANYIEPASQKKFSSQTASQVKLAKERKISQKFYFDRAETKINMKAQTVTISGDRILVVEGLRATNVQTFELGFQFGQRTPTNPEGVYVTAETLINENEAAKGGKP